MNQSFTNKILRGDALDLIQAFDKKIDLIVTDPPYVRNVAALTPQWVTEYHSRAPQ